MGFFKNLIGGGDAPQAPAAPKPLPPPPTINDPAVQAASRQAQLEAALAGRGTTVLSSPQGATGAASVAKKQLLGA